MTSSDPEHTNDLTQVELLWLKQRIENWIRFGRIADETIINSNRRVVSFSPGSIFAFVRWASNDYGTVASRIDILRAITPGERYSTVPYVRPGAEILLRLAGWPKVEKVLQAIDAIEALGIDPADAALEHWRHVHNRLSVNEVPRRYTQSRHQAWLQPAEGHAVSRCCTLITMIAAAALLTATMGPKPVPSLVWNASESVPIGFYSVQPAGKLTVTDLVVAMPPERLATFLSEGGYLPRGVPLIKRVLALPGQTVCRKSLSISVDGIEMGTARERDSRGRPLPDWQDCRVIAKGDVFLMNWDEPSSLDGRYFGTIAASSIIGRADPLWTFEED